MRSFRAWLTDEVVDSSTTYGPAPFAVIPLRALKGRFSEIEGLDVGTFADKASALRRLAEP